MSSPITTRSSRTGSRLGFTLIEMLVVVAIMGVLAAVAIPGFSKTVRRARTSEALLGLHDWVLDGGAYSRGRFLGLNPLDLFARNELSTLQLRLSNEPDAEGHPRMSRIAATEPLVNARLDVRAGFEGHTLADVLQLASFRVARGVERKEDVTLECEAA